MLSGQFLHIHTGPGKQHDRTYGSLCAPTVTANDLCIRDLGYFHLKDLQYIQDKEAYYISRIKSNTRIYQKNPNPNYFQNGRIKKGTEYIQIDMETLMNSLQPGQTCEIADAYVGMIDKVPARPKNWSNIAGHVPNYIFKLCKKVFYLLFSFITHFNDMSPIFFCNRIIFYPNCDILLSICVYISFNR